MMALSKQRKFTFNSLMGDIRGSKCCVIKVCQYIYIVHDVCLSICFQSLVEVQQYFLMLIYYTSSRADDDTIQAISCSK